MSLLIVGCVKSENQPEVGERINRVNFKNPGGMWLPTQMTEHEKTLKELGVKFDTTSFSNLGNAPMAAIVSLGNCSASFVSPQGLVITNHHCVIKALQNITKKNEPNYLVNGFYAPSEKDEKSAGSTARVFVTRSFKDVTEAVRGGIDQITNDLDRYKKIEERVKAITKTCEAREKGIRCQVLPFFEGQTYYEIEQLEIRDVRLVYSPHQGIGTFGGDIDNWKWPRHTGDYSFYRAYVGKDGKPADYSPDNVPYQPTHYLKVSSTPLKEADFVMVAGYPGRTNRLRTADEIREAAESTYKNLTQRYKQYIAALEMLTKDSDELKKKAAPRLASLHNYLLNYEGVYNGLVVNKLVDQKVAEETKLRKWIQSSGDATYKYGDVFSTLARIRAPYYQRRDTDDAMLELVGQSDTLIEAALTIGRMAEERAKPDAERDPEYQERNWRNLEQRLNALSNAYDPALDKAIMKLALQRTNANLGAKAALLIEQLFGQPLKDSDIDGYLDAIYSTSVIADPAKRLALFKTATPTDISASTDPLLRVIRNVLPLHADYRNFQKSYQGAMLMVRPRYVAALKEFTKQPLASDANSTLRVTYGTVRGYQPNPQAPVYFPFTKVTEMLGKALANGGKEPFDAPPAILDAVKAKKYGPYAAAEIGEVPVDFLADLDITGGNSGSATLNSNGELVGLVFDGNIESVASNWIFMPDITRSIHVDIRYALWIMDAVDKTHRLLQEMGQKPAFP